MLRRHGRGAFFARRRGNRGGSVLLVAVAMILTGCSPVDSIADAPADTVPARTGPSDGHARMVARLAEIDSKTAEEHPLLSDALTRRLEQEIERLPADAGPRQTLHIYRQLGEQQLRQNRLEPAIEYLDRVHGEMQRLHQAGRVRIEAVYTTAYRLAVAHMRFGETQNCCLRNAPESCIVPIRGGGLHRDPSGSRAAIRYFSEALRHAPPESDIALNSRWLLNVAYMTVDGYPDEVPEAHRIPPKHFEEVEGFPRFPNRAPELGLATFDLAGGAIVDDFDGDGYLDVVASTFDPAEPLRYFRNERNGTFASRTEKANLAGILGGFNLLQADYDNDGRLDVLVLRGAWLGRHGQIPNSLLRNIGDGSFRDVTFEAGLAEVDYPTQTGGFADYDNDGDLDLFLGNESVLDFNPPCQLFRNNGDGTFTDVAEQAGVTNRRFAKSVAWGDYDEDGDPDLYVSNLGDANRLYRNNGDGTFTDVAGELGVAGPQMSFPSWFWDWNNDGHLDLYVSSYEWNEGGLAGFVRSLLGLPHPWAISALYQGDGKGGFRDVAEIAGLTRIHEPMGANYGDLDNDGFLDFYLGTGYPDYEALMPNVMYRNQAGTRFVDVTYAGGFGHLQKGHGVVFADLDHDGDQDVFEQMGGFYLGDKFGNLLFENPGFGNRWIAVELRGRRSNRFGIGARLRVDVSEDGSSRSIYKTVNSGGSFGANPLRQTIGLGKAERIERLEVHWPTSDSTQVVKKVPLDSFVRITEGEDGFKKLSRKPIRLGNAGR